MNLLNIFKDEAKGSLNESGIKLPKGTKAAKVIFHRDLDGVFSAIVTYNQLLRQGIDSKNIRLSGIQYGDDKDKTALQKKFEKSKGQAVVLVDFARIPDDVKKPDFWSDHHVYDKEEKPKSSGRVGATEYKSDTSHLSILHTNNMVDSATLKAVDIIDSAGYSKLEDVLRLPKNFKEKGRMERLAILCNALLTNSNLLKKDSLLESFIKKTKPSLVSFYNNILRYVKLNKIQEEAVKELTKKNPDWEKVEKSRKVMPSEKAKRDIQRSPKIPYKDKIQEGALEDYEELEELKKKGKKRTEEEEKRYKELVNKDIDDTRAGRSKQISSVKEKGKFETKGSTVIQKTPRIQRFIWTQLNKKGLKHPFVIKRYPTFMQIGVNPELPDKVKEHIDLNKIRKEVMTKVQKKFGHKYNNWAFNIIDKESGGHKGITNIAALGTLGIMPKRDREKLKDLQFLEKRIKELKTYGRGKLSDEDKEKLDKAKKMLNRKALKDDEKEKYERIQKILMPTMTRLMPKKAEELKKLTSKKKSFAKERTKIMDEIEKEFIEAFRWYFNASKNIPTMGRKSDVVIPGGKEEFELESFMDELRSI